MNAKAPINGSSAVWARLRQVSACRHGRKSMVIMDRLIMDRQ